MMKMFDERKNSMILNRSNRNNKSMKNREGKEYGRMRRASMLGWSMLLGLVLGINVWATPPDPNEFKNGDSAEEVKTNPKNEIDHEAANTAQNNNHPRICKNLSITCGDSDCCDCSESGTKDQRRNK